MDAETYQKNKTDRQKKELDITSQIANLRVQGAQLEAEQANDNKQRFDSQVAERELIKAQRQKAKAAKAKQKGGSPDGDTSPDGGKEN